MVFSRSWGVRVEEMGEYEQMYKLPVKIEISSEALMYSMVIITILYT